MCTNAPLYDEREACFGVCEGFDDTAVPGVTDGNSVQCRIYHLGAASLSPEDEALHCPHATLESTPATCGDPAPGECGDGTVDDDEACDDGDANADAPDACRTDCTAPTCGDGIVDSGEVCDPGVHDIWCADDCASVVDAMCTACRPGDACGDGFRCAGVDGADDLTLCLPSCETDADCPDEFTCDQVEFGLVCFPDGRDACEALRTSEVCDNGVDDDGDDLIDCDDPTCDGTLVCEVDPEICDNGRDDDGDGEIDCTDEDCVDETACFAEPCAADRNIGARLGRGVATFTGADVRGDDASASCTPSGLDDLIFEWTAPASGSYFVRINSGTQAAVHVHQLVCDGPLRGCSRNAIAEPASFDAIEGEVLAIVVEIARTSGADTTTFVLDIGREEGSSVTCGNAIDDDLDGDVDCRDTECMATPTCSMTTVECLGDTDCDDDEFCSGDGTCICEDGRRQCDDLCVDLSEDFYNCGTCGNACDAGEACEGSRCVNAAAACRCDLVVRRYCRPGDGTCTDPEGCCATRLTGCREIEVLCSEE